MIPQTLGRATSSWLRWVAALAWGSACIVSPPLGEPRVFDSPPFYFPDGITPSPNADVIVQLDLLESVELTADIFDWDDGDTLTYSWTLLRGDFETVSTGLLTNPSRVGNAFAYAVPPVRVESCGLLLTRDNDVVVVRLDIRDTIPESQRPAAGADTYRIVIEWRIVGRGTCP
jgi:hypothetical protein